MKDYLKSYDFGTKVKINGIQDAEVTGNFTISIGLNKKEMEVIHTAQNDGKCNSPKQREIVAQKIKKFIDQVEDENNKSEDNSTRRTDSMNSSSWRSWLSTSASSFPSLSSRNLMKSTSSSGSGGSSRNLMTMMSSDK